MSTQGTMNGAEQLAVIIPGLRALGEGISREQLGAPTPCTTFTVSGVLGHMTSLGGSFAPMFRGEEPVDQPAVAAGTEVARFDTAMSALLDAVSSPGALDRVVHTPNGDMPGSTFARLVAFDGAVHGWDVAVSTGQTWELPDQVVRDIHDFARSAITEQMRDGDAFAAQQVPAADATPIEVLAAFSGRTPLH